MIFVFYQDSTDITQIGEWQDTSNFSYSSVYVINVNYVKLSNFLLLRQRDGI